MSKQEGREYNSSTESQLKTLTYLKSEVSQDLEVFQELYRRAKLDIRVLFA